MGVNSWVFKALKKRYQGTMKTKIPQELTLARHVAIEDCQHIIHEKPDYVNTVHLFKKYAVGRLVARMRDPQLRSAVYVAAFDAWSPQAKAILTHVKRDKGIEKYVWNDDIPLIVEKNEHGVQEAFEEGNWRKCSREHIRREILPLIWNALMDEKYYRPRAGEQLIVRGLPGYLKAEKLKTVFLDDDPTYLDSEGTIVLARRERIMTHHEKHDEKLYHRTFVFTLFTNNDKTEYVHKYHWEEALIDIGEADLCTVHFQRFFPDCDYLIYMDDGDGLPILLLHSFDRLMHDSFRKNVWLCKPRKGASSKELRRRARHKKPQNKWTADDKADEHQMEEMVRLSGKTWADLEAERPKQIYININKMFCKIMDDPKLRGVVQNPIIFIVGAIILSGTDYFPEPFLPGIGAEKKVWPVLFKHAAKFSHLFQSSHDVPPDNRAWRDVIIDENKFIEFCDLCYIESVENCYTIEQVKALFATREQARIMRINKQIVKLTAANAADELIEKERSKLKPKKGNYVLHRVDIRVKARHLLYNFLNWFNMSKPGYERCPDIYQMDSENKYSLWGFILCPLTGNGMVAPCVSLEYPIEIDETYKRFM